jgi:hypothetical protein
MLTALHDASTRVEEVVIVVGDAEHAARAGDLLARTASIA